MALYDNPTELWQVRANQTGFDPTKGPSAVPSPVQSPLQQMAPQQPRLSGVNTYNGAGLAGLTQGADGQWTKSAAPAAMSSIEEQLANGYARPVGSTPIAGTVANTGVTDGGEKYKIPGISDSGWESMDSASRQNYVQMMTPDYKRQFAADHPMTTEQTTAWIGQSLANSMANGSGQSGQGMQDYNSAMDRYQSLQNQLNSNRLNGAIDPFNAATGKADMAGAGMARANNQYEKGLIYANSQQAMIPALQAILSRPQDYSADQIAQAISNSGIATSGSNNAWGGFDLTSGFKNIQANGKSPAEKIAMQNALYSDLAKSIQSGKTRPGVGALYQLAMNRQASTSAGAKAMYQRMLSTMGG